MPPPSSDRPRSLLPAPRPRHSSGLPSPVPRLLLLLLLSSFILQPSSFSTPPPWWTTRGVLDPNATPDDYAPVNAGQLKNMAKALYDEIEAEVPGGASTELDNLIAGFATGVDDYMPVNLGQLKNTAKPFFDFLAPFDGPPVPWPPPGPTTDDYAPANIGQLKNVFSSLDPASLIDALSADADNDGLSGLEEIALGTDHHNPDTDGDGLNDGLEVELGTNPLVHDLIDTDGDGVPDLVELYVDGTDPMDAASFNPNRIEWTASSIQFDYPSIHSRKPLF